MGRAGAAAEGLGKSQGSGRAGLSSQSMLPAIATDAESFRSGLQSLLASLGGSSEAFSENDANRGPALAEAVPGAVKSTAGAANGGAASLLLPASKTSGNETETAGLTATSRQARSIAAATAKEIATPTTAKSGERQSAAERMSGARPVHANKAAKPEAASGQSMQALSPMPVAILPQAAQTPGIANPIEQNFTAEKAESSQAALSQTALPIDTSSAFAAASLAPHPSNPSSSEEVAGAANGAIQKTAKGSEGPAKTEQPSADSTLSEPSSGRINSIESAGAQQAPLPSAAELGEGEELLKPAAPRGNPIEPPARGASANQTQTLVPSQRSAQLSLPEQGSAPVALPSDYSTPVFAPGYERISSQAENLVLKAAPVAAASDGLAQPSMTPNAVAQSGQLAVVSSAVASSGVGKANTVVAEKISTLSRVHSERGTGGVDGIRHGNGLMPAASSSPIGDASAVTRDVAAGRGAVNTIASTGAAIGPDSREAFATLDGEGALARPSWIHAGREQAEAGFQDPSLGWVGVRADASGGGVHAEVVAGSADAAQALGSHMAGLNAYLAEHHTPVETLTLSGPEGGWTGSKSDTGGDMQQGAGQDRAQGGDAGVSAGSTQSASGSTTAQEAPAQLAGIDASAQFSRPGGAHISVMA